MNNAAESLILVDISDQSGCSEVWRRIRPRPAGCPDIAAGAQQGLRVELSTPDRVSLAEVFLSDVKTEQGSAIIAIGFNSKLLRYLGKISVIGQVGVQGCNAERCRSTVKIEAILLIVALKRGQGEQLPAAERSAIFDSAAP